MTPMMLGYAALGLFFGAAALAAYAIQSSLSERHEISKTLRAMDAYDMALPVSREQELEGSFLSRVLVPTAQRLARVVVRFLPLSSVDRLRLHLQQAGNPEGWDAERVLAAKVVLAGVFGIGIPLMATSAGVAPVRTILMVGLFGTIGYFAPDRVIRSRANQRQDEIRRALPDTLDLLAITVEAGLSFDAAAARVVERSSGPLTEELQRMLREIQLGKSRPVALRDLGERTTLPELKSFVQAMVQADVFGVSVGRTLKVQSQEMRTKRRQRAEEQAQKVPVKIIFPLVLCILPTLFIVLLGPAAINVFRALFG